jgi:hypothetical protein
MSQSQQTCPVQENRVIDETGLIHPAAAAAFVRRLAFVRRQSF